MKKFLCLSLLALSILTIEVKAAGVAVRARVVAPRANVQVRAFAPAVSAVRVRAFSSPLVSRSVVFNRSAFVSPGYGFYRARFTAPYYGAAFTAPFASYGYGYQSYVAPQAFIAPQQGYAYSQMALGAPCGGQALSQPVLPPLPVQPAPVVPVPSVGGCGGAANFSYGFGSLGGYSQGIRAFRGY